MFVSAKSGKSQNRYYLGTRGDFPVKKFQNFVFGHFCIPTRPTDTNCQNSIKKEEGDWVILFGSQICIKNLVSYFPVIMFFKYKILTLQEV